MIMEHEYTATSFDGGMSRISRSRRRRRRRCGQGIAQACEDAAAKRDAHRMVAVALRILPLYLTSLSFDHYNYYYYCYYYYLLLFWWWKLLYPCCIVIMNAPCSRG